MSRDALLLSIRPEHTRQIFAGTKSVELRRTRPRVRAGDLIVIYASTPVKAVVGACRVDDLVSALPQELWRHVHQRAGITRAQFDHYYHGAAIGFGILLTDILHFAHPLPLQQLREQWPGFWPPQTYRYLSSHEVAFIHSAQQVL